MSQGHYISFTNCVFLAVANVFFCLQVHIRKLCRSLLCLFIMKALITINILVLMVVISVTQASKGMHNKLEFFFFRLLVFVFVCLLCFFVCLFFSTAKNEYKKEQ